MKNFLDKEIFKNSDFYVKLCFTILFVAIFIVSFFSLNGGQYFYSTAYADDFKGYDFQVHTIDVEQGDCFLIKLPGNKCMLIDTGEEEFSYSVCEYIQQFLIAEGLNKIDFMVLTHPDSDHIGGAERILRKFNVEMLLRPPVYSYSESLKPDTTAGFVVDESLVYDETIKCAYEKMIDMKFFEQGLEFDFDGCQVEFLSPSSNIYSNSNDYSAVIMFSWQDKKFLFMGDAESEIEEQLISNYGDRLKADVLKIGHHGSITSTSQNFLNLVKPKYAIISSGGNSKYFPNPTILSRLEGLGAKVLATAKEGSFAVSVKNNDIVFAKAYRGPNYVALIFAVMLMFALIVWENPLKNYKGSFFTKKAS